MTKAHFDLGQAHQVAFESNRNSITQITMLYRMLIVATAAVVLLAGVNVIDKEPEVPDKPTRVILVEEG